MKFKLDINFKELAESQKVLLKTVQNLKKSFNNIEDAEKLENILYLILFIQEQAAVMLSDDNIITDIKGETNALQNT
jgi:hypothetical protein